jgi:hypothetical protein
VNQAAASDQIEELRQLSDTKSNFVFRIPNVHFTKKEQKVCELLMRRQYAHREVIFTILYSGKNVDERPDPRVIDTLVSNIRKKFAKFDVDVKRDESGAGWYLTPIDKKRLAELQTQEATKPIKIEVRKFRIERDIELPPVTHSHRGPESPYPFDDMAPGDSFFCDLSIKRVRAATHTYRRKHRDYKFAVRAMDGGVRCWRIE